MSKLTLETIKKLETNFRNKDSLVSAMNAATANGIKAVSENQENYIKEPFIFNVDLEQGDITNQKRSGRCWMFASLNVMRSLLIKKHNLKTFELSQAYPLFFDKLERSNLFLENILDCADEELNSRTVQFLLNDPLGDGGQWDMFVNLTKKYGAVPKYAYPESFNSSNTQDMNDYLAKTLRKAAYNMRKAKNEGSEKEVYEIKTKAMQDIYDILVMSLGKPPVSFDFVAYDKDHKLIEQKNITPVEFFEKYIGMDIDNYVSLIHAPTKDKPYEKTYTIKYLGNVIEGRQVKHLNLPIEELEKAAVRQLKDGKAVWFGCDVGQRFIRGNERGLLGLHTLEYEKLFGVDFDMEKEDALDYGDSLMTHAMTFQGVHLDENDQPVRWKVENSWGKDHAYEGYLSMTKDWFYKYMYQVVVHKDYLTEEQRKLYDQDPIELKPWDPMGSLA